MMRNNSRYGLVPQSWWGSVGIDLPRDLMNLLDFFGDNTRELRQVTLPRMTIDEEKDAYVVKVLMPGFDPGKIDAEVVGDFLTVRGERPGTVLEDGERFIHRERSSDHIEETIKLPGRVTPDQVAAKYVNGVLTVTLPREEEHKPKAIKVQVGK